MTTYPVRTYEDVRVLKDSAGLLRVVRARKVT